MNPRGRHLAIHAVVAALSTHPSTMRPRSPLDSPAGPAHTPTKSTKPISLTTHYHTRGRHSDSDTNTQSDTNSHHVGPDLTHSAHSRGRTITHTVTAISLDPHTDIPTKRSNRGPALRPQSPRSHAARLSADNDAPRGRHANPETAARPVRHATRSRPRAPSTHRSFNYHVIRMPRGAGTHPRAARPPTATTRSSR